MSTQPIMRCLSNVAIFDPDIVYAYTTPFIEVDYLCVYTEGSDPGILGYLDLNIPKGRYIILEVESRHKRKSVFEKRAKRALLSIAYPHTTLWLHENIKFCGAIASVKIEPWLYLVMSELLNASLYTILLLPEEVVIDKGIVDSMHQLVKDLKMLESDDGSSDPFTKLIHIVERLSSQQPELKSYIKNKLSKLVEVCRSSVWIVLIQKGVGKHRLKKIRESIDVLNGLCSALGRNTNSVRIIYVISELVEKSFVDEGVKLSEVMQLLNAQERVEIKHRDLIVVPKVGTYVHSLSRNLNYGDYVKKILEQVESATIMIFGDFSKQHLRQIIDNNMDAINSGRLRFMVIDEAFYTPTAENAYGVTTLYGYLSGVKSFIRNEKLRGLIEQPQIKTLLASLKSVLNSVSVSDSELYGILLLLFKTIIV